MPGGAAVKLDVCATQDSAPHDKYWSDTSDQNDQDQVREITRFTPTKETTQ